MSGRWAKLRRIWVGTGAVLLVVLTAWSVLASRPNAQARSAMRDDAQVVIEEIDGDLRFLPTTRHAGDKTPLLFFPGAMVAPAAYAPLARALALRGHVVVIAALPMRGAFGGGEDTAFLHRTHDMATRHGPRWVVAGHSKGGKIAALYARTFPDSVAALALVGTSHPRDISLADASYPVVQLLADRDPLASLERADRNRHNLPVSTSRIVVPGGNHSQFGDYGFQPGDRTARITRTAQRTVVVETLAQALDVKTPPQPAPHTESTP